MRGAMKGSRSRLRHDASTVGQGRDQFGYGPFGYGQLGYGSREAEAALGAMPDVLCENRRSRGLPAEAARSYESCITWMPAGPRMTTNSTGRKKMIIGTVNFGGSAAAFFSASLIRISRFSLAMTRSAWLTGVP